MITFLLAVLIILDIGLLAAVFFLNRRQEAHIEVVTELTEERRMLSELRSTVQEELEASHVKARDTLQKITKIATEAEMEVKSGGQTIATEMTAVVTELTAKFEEPLRELARKQAYLDATLKRVEHEKSVLHKLIARGEKICKFFDERVPYEEVLHEIEDKKYIDARSMLAKGNTPAAIATELGMSESEVRLVAGLSGPALR
jgi:hypothetical protein